MGNEEIITQYIGFMDTIVAKYKNHNFIYDPHPSAEILRLVGRQCLRLKFLDAHDKPSYLGLEGFLISMIELPEKLSR